LAPQSQRALQMVWAAPAGGVVVPLAAAAAAAWSLELEVVLWSS